MFIFDVNIARYWELLHQSVISERAAIITEIQFSCFRSYFALVTNVYRTIYFFEAFLFSSSYYLYNIHFVNIARYWELLHQSVIKINSTMLRSNRASVPSVVRSLYIKKKDKFRIQMYKEIKENLTVIISFTLCSVCHLRRAFP
jgi:hypothetical protein